MSRETDKKGVRPAAPALQYDVKLLFPVMMLVGIGMVMVYSASSALALKKFGVDHFFLRRQAMFAAAGIVALVACRHFPYRFYRPLAYPVLCLAVLCLAAVHWSGFGVNAGGSTRWLRIAGIGFQPSELARFALIVYLAYSLSKKGDGVRRFAIGFVPHFLVLGILSALILTQPDFGSVAILSALTMIMLFVGGVRWMHLFAVLGVLVPVAAWVLVSAPYRLARVMTFLDPWKYPADEGYQIVHSLMAFGTGGIWGTGIGKGYQKLFYLPEPHTDFIFSVIGEELGLVGVAVILFFYILIFWKGIGIAANAKDPFGSLLAVGITTAMALQIVVNMGVTLGLLPTKGLTLPFLSYGGTSLLMNMASVGILMNIGARK